MERWDNAIEQIEARFPVLCDLRVSGNGHTAGEPLPDLLKTTAAAAIQASELESGRIAVVLPRLGNASLWVALATVLAKMQGIWDGAGPMANRFERGAKVLVDGKYVGVYEGETSDGIRVAFASRDGGRLGNWIVFRKQDRLRLQPTTSNRPLSTLRNLQRPTADALDTLLGFQTFGNRSLFSSYVILVTRVSAAAEQLQRVDFGSVGTGLSVAAFDSLAELIQWGVLRRNGDVEIRSTGQRDAAPVLLLAPDLLAVRNHSRAHPHVKPLVILDGSATIEGNSDVLADVLDNCNSLACVDYSNREVMKPLANSGFRIWAWTREDMHHLQCSESKRMGAIKTNSLFGPLRVSYYNYARQNVVPIVCDGEGIQRAAVMLHEAIRHLDLVEHENSRLEASLYQCLLEVARMVRPLDANAQERLMLRLKQIRADVHARRMWLSEEGARAATALLDNLDAVVSAYGSNPPDKVNILRSLLHEGKRQKIVVLVSNATEVETTRKYWTPLLDDANVRFFDPTSVRQITDCQHLILSGWLGASRMSQLIDGCLAARITLLVYPFEQRWLLSATRRWDSGLSSAMNKDEKEELLSLGRGGLGKDVEVDLSISVEEAGSEDSVPAVDISEFELRLSMHRRTILVEQAQSRDEEQTVAYYVRFPDGYYAFLTTSRRLPVVTAIIQGDLGSEKDLPRKSLLEMTSGDYVVFRDGSQSDVLRELADRGLQRAGMGNLRDVASEWRSALREYVGMARLGDGLKYRPSRLNQLVNQLLMHGIDRTTFTIRHWIVDDSTIGPDDYRTVVPRIAEATDSKPLRARAKVVCDAIERVKGAHFSAAGYLKDRLFAALPRQLEAESISPVYHLDLDGIGTATIVRVEEVSVDAVKVAPSRANLLLWVED